MNKQYYYFLNTGHIGKNIKLYNNQQVKGISAAERPRTLSTLESYILTLVRLRRNFDVLHLSFLFELSEGTVTNTNITWINFLYVQFGSVSIWHTRAQINRIMP